jgi:hypothetical protein
MNAAVEEAVLLEQTGEGDTGETVAHLPDEFSPRQTHHLGSSADSAVF